MRRRVGVGGIQKKRLEDKKFVAKADELAENQVDGSSVFPICPQINWAHIYLFGKWYVSCILVGRIVEPALKLPGKSGNICKRTQAGDSERPRVQATLSRDVLQHRSWPTCLGEGILVKHARHRRFLLRAWRANCWGVYGFCSQDRRTNGAGRAETKVGQSQVCCCYFHWYKTSPQLPGAEEVITRR